MKKTFLANGVKKISPITRNVAPIARDVPPIARNVAPIARNVSPIDQSVTSVPNLITSTRPIDPIYPAVPSKNIKLKKIIFYY